MHIEEVSTSSSHEASCSSSASSSGVNPSLQGRAVATSTSLKSIPLELLQLIASYGRQDQRAASSAFDFNCALLRLSTGQTLGSIDQEFLLLCPDEALHAGLLHVQADVSKLDPESRTRLTELAPFLHHLNLSRMHVTAQRIRTLIAALTLPGGNRTSIIALTLSETEINNETLQELGKLKTEGLLSNLTQFEIDKKGRYLGCPCCAGNRPINETGMRALAASGFFAGLEQLSLQVRHFSNTAPTLPTSLLTGSAALRSLRDLYCVIPEDLIELKNLGILQRLQHLALNGFCSTTMNQGLQLLVESGMQLQHFELHQDYLYPAQVRNWLQSGHLPRLFQQCETIAFRMSCVRDHDIHLFSELATAGIPLYKITHLRLDSSALSTELLSDIVLYMPHLQSLTFNESSFLPCNPELFRNLTHLRDLQITRCHNQGGYLFNNWSFTSPQNVLWLQSIVRALPSLRKLIISLNTLELNQMAYFPFLSHLEEIIILKTKHGGGPNPAAIAVPPAAFTVSGLKALPNELLHLISEYANSGKSTHDFRFRFAAEPPLLQKTQTLGSLDKEVLFLRPEEILHDVLWHVEGDVTQLDSVSRTRLEELAPFIRHLNLSRIHMTAERISSLIKALAEAAQDHLYDTEITTITLSESSMASTSLRELGKQNHSLSKLNRLEIDRRRTSTQAPEVATDVHEMTKVITSSRLFHRLQHLSLPVRAFTDKSTVLPVSLLTHCRALQSFEELSYLNQHDFVEMQKQGTLKQLKRLALKNFTLTGNSQDVQQLIDSKMRLQHLELGENPLSAKELRAWKESGFLQQLFLQSDTLSLYVRLVKGCDKQFFRELAAADIPLHKVTHLRLDVTELDDAFIGDLVTHMPHLQSLSFNQFSIKSFDPSPLRKLTKLERLQLLSWHDSSPPHKKKQFTSPEGTTLLRAIIQTLPHLQKLTVGLHSLDLKQMVHFPFLSHLPEVIIFNSKETDRAQPNALVVPPDAFTREMIPDEKCSTLSEQPLEAVAKITRPI